MSPSSSLKEQSDECAVVSAVQTDHLCCWFCCCCSCSCCCCWCCCCCCCSSKCCDGSAFDGGASDGRSWATSASLGRDRRWPMAPRVPLIRGELAGEDEEKEALDDDGDGSRLPRQSSMYSTSAPPICCCDGLLSRPYGTSSSSSNTVLTRVEPGCDGVFRCAASRLVRRDERDDRIVACGSMAGCGCRCSATLSLTLEAPCWRWRRIVPTQEVARPSDAIEGRCCVACSLYHFSAY